MYTEDNIETELRIHMKCLMNTDVYLRCVCLDVMHMCLQACRSTCERITFCNQQTTSSLQTQLGVCRPCSRNVIINSSITQYNWW